MNARSTLQAVDEFTGESAVRRLPRHSRILAARNYGRNILRREFIVEINISVNITARAISPMLISFKSRDAALKGI